jgi:hypothetical protein
LWYQRTVIEPLAVLTFIGTVYPGPYSGQHGPGTALGVVLAAAATLGSTSGDGE